MLSPVTHKCIFIGVQLKVSDSKIQTIKLKYSSPEEWLYEILRYRLSQLPPLTVYNVVQALESKSVQENRVAHEIRCQYMPQTSASPQMHAGVNYPAVPACSTSTPHHSHQIGQKRAGQDLSQHQHTSGHVPETESHNTTNEYALPPAKKVRQDATCAMDQFIGYIKTIYKQSVIENNLNVIKWPPTPSKIFINLACIDWRTVVTQKQADELTRAMVEDGNVDVIMKKKTPIEFRDIVENLPDTTSKKIILIEGAPGVGKSTFAWEFCRRWERGEIAQQYQLVLLLRLRDQRMSNAQNLRDLLYHPLREIADAVEKNLIMTAGDKCLVILEGFDELPDACRMESSVFLELIRGELLPQATILVTSRPWATSALLDTCHHRIFQHIEILGFTEHHIEEYVRSVFEDREDEEKSENNEMKEETIEDIMTYIATYPQIKACMYIPLNSAIVVSVYQESKAGGCDLPKTLTELYYALTQTLLLRYLRGHPVHKKIRHIQSLEKDLPQEVYGQLLKISEIAYNGICTDWGGSVQLIYSDLLPTFETLGLMQSVSQMYVTQGVNVSHNFLHLTVQEFLAALHISNMPPKEQLKHFKRHKEGRFRVVLRFLAGLTKLVNISLEHRRALLEKPRSYPTPRQRLASMENPHNVSAQDTSYTQMKSDISVSVHPLNWLFETQSSDVIKAWLQDKTVEFKFPRQMSPLECYSAGYCIAHSSAQWVLTIQEHKEETDLKMFCDGITSTKEADFKIGLKVLVHMATEKTETLLTNLGPHIQELHLKLRDGSIVLENLSALQVLHLELNCKETFDLTTSLLLQSLESLTVEAGSGSNVLGLKSCAAIRVLASSLKYLKFRSGKKELHGWIRKQIVIDSKCMESITKAMANNTSLQLMSLEMDCACTFTATAAEWLTTFITNSKQLQNLHIGSQCILEQEGIESLVKALANNESLPLKNLTLHVLEISDTTADSLALLIHKCTTIEFVIGETDDSTRDRHRIMLITVSSEREGKCLKFSSGKKELLDSMQGNQRQKIMQINSKCMESITKAMAENTSLQLMSLEVDCACTFTATAAEWLATFITNSKQLQNLHIGPQCILEQEGIESLVKALANNESLPLKNLTLPTLEISDTAADSLALLIQKYMTVEFVTGEKLCFVRGRITLVTASSEREKLQIWSEGIQGITKVIACNTSLSLKSLHIEDSQQAAESIIKALANNDSLPLKRLTLPTLGISDTAADSLGLFVQRCATLEFVTWERSRITLITACRLREMANAEHHYFWLPPAATGPDHHCVVNCIEDGIDFDHIWQHHSFHGAFTCHNIGDEGACSFGASLIKNSNVRRLYFNSNHAHPVLTKVLHHGRHHLTNKKISDAGVTALAQALYHNSTLEVLDLSNNSISDVGTTAVAQVLHHNSTLLQLDLSNNSVSDAGTTAVAQALRYNSTLWKLNLSNNSLSDAGVTAVAQALRYNSTLWKLNLSNNSLSDAGVTAVAQALHHNSTLRKLNLSNNSLSDAGVTAVAQALHHNSTLRKLNLSNNSLSDAGVTAVAQALHHNSTLQKLNLSNNSLSDAGVTAVAQALHHNSTLWQLNLSNNSLSDAGVTAVAQALHHNSTLRKLDLSNNSLSDAGVTAVAQALHHNSTLWQLNLSNSSLSDAGVTAVAQALHHNSTLQKLDLSNNSIGDAGATVLAQRLSRLGGLNLSGNDTIHKEGTCELVHALNVTTHSVGWITQQWTHWGCLVLPKRCEEFATQCPEYVQVKTRVKFV